MIPSDICPQMAAEDWVGAMAVNVMCRRPLPFRYSGSPYSAAKAGSDLIALAYHETYDLPVLVTRSSNQFGPYQFPEKLIPYFVTSLLDGKKVPLYGDGLNVRDWLFVRDNCTGVDLVLRNGTVGEIYNKTVIDITTELARQRDAIEAKPSRTPRDAGSTTRSSFMIRSELTNPTFTSAAAVCANTARSTPASVEIPIPFTQTSACLR